MSGKQSNTSNKVNQKLVQPVYQKLVQREPYWRIPKSVGECHELTFAARCVYGILATKIRQGNIATMGYAEIARRLGCSRTTVTSSIAGLIRLGHIVAADRSPRSKGTYMLTSNRFAIKQEDGVTEIVSCPKGHRKMVSVGPERLRA